ncbi:MAG: tyrosine-type recombinase/integrase [Rhodospirillales bacterium]|nr:tyrosine-type recombinase/integrase [Rhodospirillales bacterium]
MGKLSVSAVKAATKPGRHANGATLYLNVKRSGAKSWVQRVVVDGRRHDLGLGPYPVVSLAKARRHAADNRALIADGGDPLARKRKAKVSMFREAAQLIHEANVERWKTGRHTDRCLQVVERYAVPAFGEKAIDRIGREDVLGVLVPIWRTKPEYARKLRQRLRIVLDWVVAHGYVNQNFAGGAIRGALPAMPAVKEHHRTLHYAEIGKAIESVENCRASKSVKLLWRFLVLTAVRGGEARRATWNEISFDEKLWHVPASRMKAGRAFEVPLSDAAVAVLREAENLREEGSDLVFPGVRKGKPLTDSTLSKTLRKAGVGMVPHGVRAMFRTWADERKCST